MRFADSFIERLTEQNIVLGFDKNQKSQDGTGFEVADVSLLNRDDAARVVNHLRQKIVNVKHYYGSVSEDNTQLIDACTEIIKKYPGLAWTCSDAVKDVIEMVKPEDRFVLNNKALGFYNAMKNNRVSQKEGHTCCYICRKEILDELTGKITTSSLRDKGVDNLFKEDLAKTLCLEDKELSKEFLSHMDKVVSIAKLSEIKFNCANNGMIDVCSKIVEKHPENTKYCIGLVNRFANITELDETMRKSVLAHHNKARAGSTNNLMFGNFMQNNR